MVVVPDDTEFKRRVAVRENLEGKEIPDQAVFNMKSNFVVPEIEEPFSDVSTLINSGTRLSITFVLFSSVRSGIPTLARRMPPTW